jgi:hypothetical protein
MTVAKDQWHLKVFFDQLFEFFIRTQLDWLYIVLLRAMIRITERALELSFDDEFLVLTFHHDSFNAFTASSFLATHQNNRLSIFEIEEMVAEGAL